MNVLLVASQDFYSNLMLAGAVRDLKHKHHLTLAVCRYRTKERKGDFALARKIAKKTGWALLFCQWMELVLFDKIAWLRNLVPALRSRVYTTHCDIEPGLYFDSINSESFIQFVKDRKIDLLFCLRQNEILKRRTISSVRVACVNVHPAKLPDYPGVMTSFFSLLNGETTSAVSFHQMTPKLDEGEIYFQPVFDITHIRSLCELHLKAHVTAANSFGQVVENIEKQRKHPRLPRGERLYTWPTKQEVADFYGTGFRFFEVRVLFRIAFS